MKLSLNTSRVKWKPVPVPEIQLASDADRLFFSQGGSYNLVPQEITDAARLNPASSRIHTATAIELLLKNGIAIHPMEELVL